MKTKLITLTMMMLILMCGGCGNDWMCDNLGWFCPKNPTNKPEVNIVEDVENAQNIVEESTTTIEESTKKISTEANKINRETTEVERKVPADTKNAIVPHIDSIKESSTTILEETTTINKASAELSGAKSLLDGAGKKIAVVEDALDKMTKERDKALEDKRKAEEDRDSALHETLQWLIVGCIIGCGAFIVLFFYTGSKGGLFAAGGCGMVLIIAIFVNMYIVWLAIGGGVLLLLMVGWLLYNIYIKNKAFKEIVETVEIAKNELSPESKIKIFGEKPKEGYAKKIQSSATESEVKKVKNKIPELWKYNKKKEGDSSIS